MPLYVIAFPAFDPVLIRLGPIAIRWYALAYIVGILVGWAYARAIIKREALWGGRPAMTVRDYDKMHQGVGMLLAELMRIKAEGDYDAIKALVDRYGVHFNPALRDQVVARYQKLELPIYWTGINPTLYAKTGPDGAVTDVVISYPRDYVKQQLGYAAMYAQ